MCIEKTTTKRIQACQKMFARKPMTLKSHVLLLSLVLGTLRTSCKAQFLGDETKQVSGTAGKGGGAFYALRSCHRRLGGDSGDFFSPDYLCANPPLWCNWTIQAPDGKRVYLHLQDLTPNEDCHLKQDQIHVDEPVKPSSGTSAGHRVLQGCWREATYASLSDTLRVVLLIGGWPAQQYRGFYARYRTFGPPVAYHPSDGTSGPDGNWDLEDWDEFGPMIAGERERRPTATADVFPLLDSSNIADAPESPHGTSRLERGAPRILLDPSDPTGPAHEQVNQLPGGFLPTLSPNAGPNLPENQNQPTEAGQNKMVTNTSSSSGELSDHGGTLNIWNSSQALHQPGDQLFEVSVEVQLNQEHKRNQHHLDGSLIKSVRALVLQHLDGLHIPISLSFKRIKRLRAGELYIMWLSVGSGRSHAFSGIHQNLHNMVGSSVGPVGSPHHSVVASVSIGDVNECGTQLALCGVNADCLDQFGSYRCRCKDGFRDESHLGPVGTVCVERKPAGCSRGLSGETKGVYVLFFLLSFLLLMSLAVACALYSRRRCGAFLPKGQTPDSARRCPDDDNAYAAAASDLSPPPPPARGPRDAWPIHKERCVAVDLPLLRFSPLTPSDVYTDSQEGGKK
ncbi:uncharacterized protein zgc:66455 isoform X1 [Syngnathus acus]|uniref:uncharacterized protein zgc:66455 isoform X1 n=1 Tax=Syngnathus acus TaxID=161584 RepID=UPI001886266D|nr:uncharacterized protein zgc:66455 isoform X1 [Syngnathus acus]